MKNASARMAAEHFVLCVEFRIGSSSLRLNRIADRKFRQKWMLLFAWSLQRLPVSAWQLIDGHFQEWWDEEFSEARVCARNEDSQHREQCRKHLPE
jgi:hypothetical protein